jgi:hypothetical protein
MLTTMAHKTLAIIAALSLVGVIFLVYLAMTFEPPESTRTVTVDTPVARPVERVMPAADPVIADPAPVQAAPELVTLIR